MQLIGFKPTTRFVLSALSALTTAALSALIAPSASAQVTVTASNGIVYQTTGLSSSGTTGADMDGMLVTATFIGGGTQTLSWADLSATTGGVSGTGWSLTNTGSTTFADGSWTLTNSGLIGITSVALNGAPGHTIFDRTFGGADGTTGSSAGKDFAVTSGLAGYAITAEYSNILRLGTAAPVGDLYTTLTLHFNSPVTGFAPTGVLHFSADTDNATAGSPISATIPEPGTLAFLAVGSMGMLGSLAARRRKR